MDKILPFSAGSLLISFLLGSIPWGVIISRLFYHRDIREYGSGNIGTTNAFRTMGKVGGVAVFSLDFLKGLLAGFIAMVFAILLVDEIFTVVAPPLVTEGSFVYFGYRVALDNLDQFAAHLFGLVVGLGLIGAMCGHVFSPWLRFKGGKGVAVAAGALVFTMGWKGLLIVASVFAVMTIVTRYVSVGSISAAIVAPFVAYWAIRGEQVFVALVCCAATLVIWAHRGNIARLKAGNENRIGKKSTEEVSKVGDR